MCFRAGALIRVKYLPAELDSGMFGGNSNWRGPVWMPVNALLIRALLSIICIMGIRSRSSVRPGPAMDEFVRGESRDYHRLIGTFLRDEAGRQAGLWRRGQISD